MKNYTNELGHLSNMAAIPINGKNLKKSSSPESIDQWAWNLVCGIVYGSTTKVVQIMTLGWPWPILHQGQIRSHRLLYGKKWKLLFFGNYCSLRYQSCLKHSTKWVNEVEWVSKVKVILWPWSKVTQISKLNVWLWVVYSGERFRASWPSCLYLPQITTLTFSERWICRSLSFGWGAPGAQWLKR